MDEYGAQEFQKSFTDEDWQKLIKVGEITKTLVSLAYESLKGQTAGNKPVTVTHAFRQKHYNFYGH